METLWIDIALSVLFATVKAPAKVILYKRALRKLRDALVQLPLGD